MSADFLHDFIIPDSVTRFKYYAYKILPLVYDDSLSYYELLNKVVYKLNEIITTNETLISNDTALATAYKKVEQYVNDTFDSLDWDSIKDEIIGDATEQLEIIVNELVSSGAIADLLPVPFCNLTMNYIGGLSYTETKTPASSFCLVGNVGIFYGDGSPSNVPSVITTMALDTGNILSETNINLGHGNDLTFDNVHTCLWSIDSEPVNGLYRLFKISYPNMAITNTYTSSYPLKGCAFYNSKLYVYSFGNENGSYYFRLFNANTSNGNLTEIGHIAYSDGNTHIYQGMFIFENRVFIISTNPDAICEFNITNGQFIQAVKVPKYNNEGLLMGECEGADIMNNGNICMLSTYTEHLYGTPYNRDRERITLFNEFNVNHNLIPKFGVRERVALAENIHTIHVDNSQQNYKGNGTAGNPYSSLLFASACEKTPNRTYAYSIDNAVRNKTLFFSNQECIVNLKYAGCTIYSYYSKLIIQSRFTIDGVATSFPYSINSQYSSIRNQTVANITNNVYHANNFYLNVGDTVQATSDIQGCDTYYLVGTTNQIPLYTFAKITVQANDVSANFMLFTENSVQWLSAPVNSSHNDTMFIRVARISGTNFVEVTNAMINTTNATIQNVTFKSINLYG